MTPEGVSSEVLSTLRMLAQVQSPQDVNRKSAENMNLLNLVNNKVIEDQEQKKIRKSVELSKQISRWCSASLHKFLKRFSMQNCSSNNATG